jgi:glycosyltransferase involved in cell wall biosynthesis
VARYLQAADVYVHASRYETFGIAIAEAMACGTPVVATATGGIPEVVRDGADGLLVPGGDAAAMAAAIRRLLADAPLRLSLGANAAARARASFDGERMVDAYLDWFAEVLAVG